MSPNIVEPLSNIVNDCDEMVSKFSAVKVPSIVTLLKANKLPLLTKEPANVKEPVIEASDSEADTVAPDNIKLPLSIIILLVVTTSKDTFESVDTSCPIEKSVI